MIFLLVKNEQIMLVEPLLDLLFALFLSVITEHYNFFYLFSILFEGILLEHNLD